MGAELGTGDHQAAHGDRRKEGVMQRTLVFGAAALVLVFSLVLALSPYLSPTFAQERVPALGGVYEGTLTGECSRGTITTAEEFSLATADYGAMIVILHMPGVSLPPPLTSPTAADWPVNVSVANDDSFSASFLLSGVVSVHLEGRFQSTRVSGSYRASASGKVCEGTFQARLVATQQAEATFQAEIEFADGCGGGSITIARAADLLSITRISVQGFVAGDRTFSGSTRFDAGTVPIDPDTGSFGWAYFPGSEPGQEIAISGSFVSRIWVGYLGYVRGQVTVSPSTCGARGFISPASAPPPVGGGPRLPRSGTGPANGSSAALRWELVVAVLGLVALGAGLVAHRRRAA